MEVFNFDPASIDWADYIMYTHIPGLKKYVLTKLCFEYLENIYKWDDIGLHK